MNKIKQDEENMQDEKIDSATSGLTVAFAVVSREAAAEAAALGAAACVSISF